ncbi:hypothetical protein EV363DRAFT_1176528, partial [Boletus edulis]
AVDAQRHDEAISHYTTALTFNPTSPQGIFGNRVMERGSRRCKAGMGSSFSHRGHSC